MERMEFIFNQIIEHYLENVFDSHAFIESLKVHQLEVYNEFVEKHRGNLPTAHAEISNFLRNHHNILSIDEIIEKQNSENVNGNESLNAVWRKVHHA